VAGFGGVDHLSFFEWKVMPFGPSEFQKVITKIFEPILDKALIYIDDILLFSKTIEEHIQLIRQFIEICQEFGIMLSEKKMILAQQKIQFLGMDIDQGKFQPGRHIAKELCNTSSFPISLRSGKYVLKLRHT